MSSEVDICNIALANIGASARVTSIDPPDGSAESIHCERFYRVARDSLLEQTWSFNLRRVPGVVTTTNVDEQWDYLYGYPSDALTILAVLPVGAADDDQMTVPFKVEMFGDSLVIATDEPEAVIRYTARVIDSEVFSPTFVQALGWSLGSMLAGPIIRGDAGAALARNCMQMAEAIRGRAADTNARNRHGRPRHVPRSIRARGGFGAIDA